jgi:hypothetical protein
MGAFHHARQYAGSTGSANGSRHEGVLEPKTLRRQQVHMRRLEKWMFAAQHVEALIVGQDKQKIGPLNFLSLLRIAANEQQDECQQRVFSHGAKLRAQAHPSLA